MDENFKLTFHFPSCIRYGSGSDGIVSINGISGGSYYYHGDYGAEAVAALDQLFSVKAPASVWINGRPYIEILEYTKFIDDGASAYDAVDGFITVTSLTYQLCSIPNEMQRSLQSIWDDSSSDIQLDASQLRCFKTVTSLNTNIAGNLTQV